MGRAYFSERTYEFCFNSDFVRRAGGLLASYPHLPSLAAEKDLGYDVEFRLKSGEYRYSVFFQHKVPHYAKKKAGRNARFYDPYNSPYYRFVVNTEQHNKLVDLAGGLGIDNVFYSSPRFHRRQDLEKHFKEDEVFNNTVLIGVSDIGKIINDTTHHITYAPHGGPIIFHSESQEIEGHLPLEGLLPPLSEAAVTTEFVNLLHNYLVSRSRLAEEDIFLEPTTISRIQYVLAKEYSVSWFVLP